MYILERTIGKETDRFGPFPTEDRAKKYAESFEDDGVSFKVLPIIVPNCVTVKLNY